MKPGDCCSNSLWFIFIGWNLGILWFLLGTIWFISLIGIPFGIRAFKIGYFIFCPFGKEIGDKEEGISCYDSFFNILWIIFGGFILSIVAFIEAVLSCITIIGIPFGLELFKIAKFSLFPFGKRIKETNNADANDAAQPIVVVQPIINIAPNQKHSRKHKAQPKQPQIYIPPPQYTTL